MVNAVLDTREIVNTTLLVLASLAFLALFAYAIWKDSSYGRAPTVHPTTAIPSTPGTGGGTVVGTKYAVEASSAPIVSARGGVTAARSVHVTSHHLTIGAGGHHHPPSPNTQHTAGGFASATNSSAAQPAIRGYRYYAQRIGLVQAIILIVWSLDANQTYNIYDRTGYVNSLLPPGVNCCSFALANLWIYYQSKTLYTQLRKPVPTWLFIGVSVPTPLYTITAYILVGLSGGARYNFYRGLYALFFAVVLLWSASVCTIVYWRLRSELLSFMARVKNTNGNTIDVSYIQVPLRILFTVVGVAVPLALLAAAVFVVQFLTLHANESEVSGGTPVKEFGDSITPITLILNWLQIGLIALFCWTAWPVPTLAASHAAANAAKHAQAMKSSRAGSDGSVVPMVAFGGGDVALAAASLGGAMAASVLAHQHTPPAGGGAATNGSHHHVVVVKPIASPTIDGLLAAPNNARSPTLVPAVVDDAASPPSNAPATISPLVVVTPPVVAVASPLPSPPPPVDTNAAALNPPSEGIIISTP